MSTVSSTQCNHCVREACCYQRCWQDLHLLMVHWSTVHCWRVRLQPVIVCSACREQDLENRLRRYFGANVTQSHLKMAEAPAGEQSCIGAHPHHRTYQKWLPWYYHPPECSHHIHHAHVSHLVSAGWSTSLKAMPAAHRRAEGHRLLHGRRLAVALPRPAVPQCVCAPRRASPSEEEVGGERPTHFAALACLSLLHVKLSPALIHQPRAPVVCLEWRGGRNGLLLE